MRRILITGSTGFIGRNLVNTFLMANCDVGILLRQPLKDEFQFSSKVKTFLVTEENESIQKLIDGFKPEVVIHLASLFLVEHSSNEINPLIESNLLFGTVVLDAAVKAGASCFINTGSIWQDYTAPGRSVNLYAATKSAFQEIINYYVDAFGLRAITLKLSDTYGKGDKRKKLIPLLIRTASSGETLEMSPGEQELDLVHIDDICSGFFQAEKLVSKFDKPKHEIYNLTSGNTVTVKRLVEICNVNLISKIRASFGGRPYRSREVMKPFYPNPRLPGWTCSVDLDIGLRRVLEEEGLKITNESR